MFGTFIIRGLFELLIKGLREVHFSQKESWNMPWWPPLQSGPAAQLLWDLRRRPVWLYAKAKAAF